jgi:hypothetical protein
VASSFFSADYRFAGAAKTAQVPQWLADSLDDRFEGDLGLVQTTPGLFGSEHKRSVRVSSGAEGPAERLSC